MGQQRVLVAGATGYVGGGVARMLREKGFWVRGLSRDAVRLKAPDDVDDVFVGQVTDAATIEGLCDGIDVVFSSIGIHSFSRKPTLWEVDYSANMNLVREAKRAGVKRFVFISVCRGPEMAKTSRIAEARELVVQAIIDSGMDYTIYRPTGYFNDMGHLFHPLAKRGVAIMYGDPEVRINPLHSEDFGEEVARAIAEDTENSIRAVGGPQVFRRREIAELAFATLGWPVKIKTRPNWMVKMIAWVLRPYNANLSALIHFLAFSFENEDMTGEPLGKRQLKDFFAELAPEYTRGRAED
jgi:uncharacterized protein YbjT (DUF2867 family)